MALSSRQFATKIDHEETIFNHGPLSAWHSNLMYFSFLSERGGRRRPARGAKHLVHTYYVVRICYDTCMFRVIAVIQTTLYKECTGVLYVMCVWMHWLARSKHNDAGSSVAHTRRSRISRSPDRDVHMSSAGVLQAGPR